MVVAGGNNSANTAVLCKLPGAAQVMMLVMVGFTIIITITSIIIIMVILCRLLHAEPGAVAYVVVDDTDAQLEGL